MVVTMIVIAASAFAATFLGTQFLLRSLQARAILDHPNERSSHAVATPVGGGLVVIAVIAGEWLLVWALSAIQNGGEFTYPVPLVVGITLALAAGVMARRPQTAIAGPPPHRSGHRGPHRDRRAIGPWSNLSDGAALWA